MAVPTLTCPECRTVLRPTKPLPEGKSVTCPKCGTVFAAGLARAPEPAASAKKSKPAAKKAAPAPPKKKPAHHDDDDDFGTYAVIKEKEADEDDEDGGKPKIIYAPDLSVKDPRGPAQAEVITPTNFLLAVGIIACLLLTVGLFWAVFPFVFSDYVVDHEEVLKEHFKGQKDAKNKSIPQERKDVDKNPQMKQIVDNATDDAVKLRVTLISIFVVGLVYYAVMAMSVVRMQQLESYRWAMTGAIMAMIPFGGAAILAYLILQEDTAVWELINPIWPAIMVAVPAALALPLGIWCLVLLRSEKVRAGFEYVPD
jgi:hypothetical protein